MTNVQTYYCMLMMILYCTSGLIEAQTVQVYYHFKDAALLVSTPETYQLGWSSKEEEER